MATPRQYDDPGALSAATLDKEAFVVGGGAGTGDAELTSMRSS